MNARLLSISAGAASLVYVVLAARFAARIWGSDLYPDTRRFLGGWLVATIALFVVALVVAYSERRRRESAVPVLGAATFGSVICVLFYGP